MKATEILAGFESIGAVVRLTPAGIVNVDAPSVPELEELVAAAKANRPEIVAELKRQAVLSPPGRAAERPCLRCGRQCPDGVLFDTEACFEAWKARRQFPTSPRAARTTTSAAGSTPREVAGPRGEE